MRHMADSYVVDHCSCIPRLHCGFDHGRKSNDDRRDRDLRATHVSRDQHNHPEAVAAGSMADNHRRLGEGWEVAPEVEARNCRPWRDRALNFAACVTLLTPGCTVKAAV